MLGVPKGLEDGACVPAAPKTGVVVALDPNMEGIALPKEGAVDGAKVLDAAMPEEVGAAGVVALPNKGVAAAVRLPTGAEVDPPVAAVGVENGLAGALGAPVPLLNPELPVDCDTDMLLPFSKAVAPFVKVDCPKPCVVVMA